MSKSVKWGVLSTANIALNHVIPAINLSNNGKVAAIASSNTEKVNKIAAEFNIPKVYNNYEDLFLDDEIDAIYNPLPNNLHLEYTLKALKKGKHILCEKPIGLNAKEAAELNAYVKDFPNLKLMEGFMYKFHPQWLAVKEIIKKGDIGNVKAIHTLFSYYNADGNNIRNRKEAGGGALMDIGCYCISYPRFILDKEPISVFASIAHDVVFETDFLTSGILNFDNQVVATFSCTTQAYRYQRCHVLGDKGHIEIEVPCNAPTSGECKIILNNDAGKKEMIFNANQYQLQCEAFADAILNDEKVPFTLNDAENNMKVIDALLKSAKSQSLINTEI
ncbi:Gfo/Idh/MocA family protein [Pedobacter alpinus]|uniref:Gfo/Idh/MocA family protein n=1 Tax=Pedobacter alpinus TaxID=1590643 RepID=A0ABW5TUF1_9SPHI